MIAGSVHDLLTEFSGWRGAKLCVSLSQGTPWLLTVRTDLAAERGDIDALRGLRLTAAEGPDLAFKQMLRSAGLDPERDLEIVELPGVNERHVSFGVFAAEALQEGRIDGFWANAVGAETAVASGTGKIHVDVRRGDDPDEARFFTFAGLATTDDFIARESAALIAAIVERDAQFYDPVISEAAVQRLNAFAISIGHLTEPVPYEQVVASRCRRLWSGD
jgi:ABC-type nitrate/sulfonate/bicarbonate transport system substrate-binding protein